MTAKRVGAAKPRTKKPKTAKQILDLDRLNTLWAVFQKEELAKREQELNALPEGDSDERQTLVTEIARLKASLQ